MQSWQADLVNTCLSLSLKPALRYVSSLRAIRTVIRLADSTVGRLASPGETTATTVVSPSDNCVLKWIKPENVTGETQRVVLYLPGGAYIMRTPNLHTALVSRICLAAEASSLICYYRLAPEHPFPACLEDALEAYDLLLAQGKKPQDIAIAGDSAGGGLALSLLLAIRDSRRSLPGCAVLMSPLLDAGDHTPSRVKNSKTDSALPHPSRRGVDPRAMYIGEHDPKDPLISPIYGSFEELPPIYVLVSDSEMLLDDSLRLARKAHMFQTKVRVDVWRKVPHVWVSMSFLPESTDGINRIGQFLRDNIRC
jgi:monoterpene epsilon-lactone hydrolase